MKRAGFYRINQSVANLALRHRLLRRLKEQDTFLLRKSRFCAKIRSFLKNEPLLLAPRVKGGKSGQLETRVALETKHSNANKAWG